MWTYRVVKNKNGNFTVGEAYHNSDKSIWGVTEEEYPQGESVDDLIEDLEMMLIDIKNGKDDIIDMNTFKPAKADFEDELNELEIRCNNMTDEELDEFCKQDELNCMDHPEFDFVKELSNGKSSLSK